MPAAAADIYIIETSPKRPAVIRHRLTKHRARGLHTSNGDGLDAGSLIKRGVWFRKTADKTKKIACLADRHVF